MKKLVCLFLLFVTVATFGQKLDRKARYDYSEHVDFRIYGIQKSRTADRNYETFIAEKGYRFYTIVFEFKNNSSETQIIDFETIFIQDKKGNLHKVDLVVMAMKMTSTIKKFQQKLKPNKKRKIIAQFTPPIHKDERIEKLIIDNVPIILTYN